MEHTHPNWFYKKLLDKTEHARPEKAKKTTYKVCGGGKKRSIASQNRNTSTKRQ